MELCRLEEGRAAVMTLPISPSKFLAAEASAVLSTLETIPEFAETMELIDSVSGVNLFHWSFFVRFKNEAMKGKALLRCFALGVAGPPGME